MAPDSDDPQAVSLNALREVLAGRRIAVLTGAGCSTESGIPDYRGPSGSHRKRRTIRYQEFVKDPGARTRYWARSAVGWPRFATAQPNDGHRALARLEALGVLTGLITQNVDGLHGAAGSNKVVELHGSLHRVRCLACGWWIGRHELQRRLLESNPACASWGAELAPDGDAELGPEHIAGFRVPECGACAGMLKPDVVFFGENVPGPVVDEAWRVLDEAEVLLVVGSSLEVFSGFRFVRRAAERRMPVAILNLGPTRGDELATVRVELPAGKALGALVDALAAKPTSWAF
ncbi:MAG TPA: NAD-dependent protein deacetylase [Myxococcaceae bacterium]|nr:NAD-dependent protein deacetylase [Myxococcaceae bacterium]